MVNDITRATCLAGVLPGETTVVMKCSHAVGTNAATRYRALAVKSATSSEGATLSKKGSDVQIPVKNVANPKVRRSSLRNPPIKTRVPNTKQKIAATAEAME
jgi:hypothetical protein